MPKLGHRRPSCQPQPEIGEQKHQSCRQAPQIIQRAHLPQGHLAIGGGDIPKACRDGHKQGPAAPLSPVGHPVQQIDQQRIYPGVAKIKPQLWRHKKQLLHGVGDHPAVHVQAVGAHRRRHIGKRGQPLLGQEAIHIHIVVGQIGRKGVEDDLARRQNQQAKNQHGLGIPFVHTSSFLFRSGDGVCPPPRRVSQKQGYTRSYEKGGTPFYRTAGALRTVWDDFCGDSPQKGSAA